VFRAVNDLPLPGWLYPAIWLLMQGGNIGAVRWWRRSPSPPAGCAWP